MPQLPSWTIPNSGGSAFRSAINTALAALQSCSSGTAAPSPTVAGMLWFDTTNLILKRRNNANTAWIDVNADTIPATSIRGNSSGSAAPEASLTPADVWTMMGSSSALSSSSYWVGPGASGARMCIEWGSQVTTTAGATVTFPLAFNTAPRVFVTPLTTTAIFGSCQTPTTTSVFMQTRDNTTPFSNVAGTLFWLAIGNV